MIHRRITHFKAGNTNDGADFINGDGLQDYLVDKLQPYDKVYL